MTSSADRIIARRMPRQALRARMGLYLAGPMPTIAQLRQRFSLGLSAGCYWHAAIARARREFGA